MALEVALNTIALSYTLYLLCLPLFYNLSK